MSGHRIVDAIVVGAGAAGHSAALVLGRARRNVVLVDRGASANLPAPSVGGLLGHDRVPPQAFYRTCRRQLARYRTVAAITGSVVAVHAEGPSRHAVLDDGTRLEARHIVLATGMRSHRSSIPGLERFWGTSAFHCPFCHGPDHCDVIAVAIVHDQTSAALAALMTNWTGDVTAVAPATLEDGARQRLRAARVHVEAGEVVSLHGNDDRLTSVELADGRRLRAQALLAPAAHVSTDDLPERAGVALTPTGHIVVDPAGRTSVPGIWAVGDRTDPAGNLARAVAAGSDAAMAIVRDLTLGQPGGSHI